VPAVQAIYFDKSSPELGRGEQTAAEMLQNSTIVLFL
jgi:hypothetical protein